MSPTWSELRGMSEGSILTALDIGAYDPQCPLCTSTIETHSDPSFGVSVRCRSSRCRLGRLDWQWPEWLAAELWRVDIDEARRRLLDAREHGHTVDSILAAYLAGGRVA